jgi:Archaeal PaREP1/PaREP8 family.
MAVLRISEELGEWFKDSWATACMLHVEGFHEARMSSKEVRAWMSSVERMFEKAREIVGSQRA